MMDLTKLLNDDDWGDFAKTTQKTSTTPFPQANSLERVLDLLNAVSTSGVEQQKFIDEGIVNNPRQADYYANAAIYLGLVKKIGQRYYPTGMGAKLKAVSVGEAQHHVLAAIALAHPSISEFYTTVFMFDSVEERKNVIANIVVMGGNELAVATIDRRTACVYAWLVWIQKNLARL